MYDEPHTKKQNEAKEKAAHGADHGCATSQRPFQRLGLAIWQHVRDHRLESDVEVALGHNKRPLILLLCGHRVYKHEGSCSTGAVVEGQGGERQLGPEQGGCSNVARAPCVRVRRDSTRSLLHAERRKADVCTLELFFRCLPGERGLALGLRGRKIEGRVSTQTPYTTRSVGRR
jgi:hypothetical protein